MKKSRMGNKHFEIILNSIADGVFTIDHKKTSLLLTGLQKKVYKQGTHF